MNQADKLPLLHPTRHLFAPKERATLSQFAGIIIPFDSAIAITPDEAEVVDMIDAMFTGSRIVYPTAFRICLWLFEHGTFQRKRLSQMAPEEQYTYALSWDKSRVYLTRVLFKFLRVMVQMAYFNHPKVKERLHYAPQ